MNIVQNFTPHLHKLHNCTCSTPCLHRFDLICTSCMTSYHCTEFHSSSAQVWSHLYKVAEQNEYCTSFHPSFAQVTQLYVFHPLFAQVAQLYVFHPLYAQVWPHLHKSHDKLSLYWVSLLICTSLTSSAQSCITNDIVLSSPLICSSQYCTLSRISSLHDPVLTNAQVPLDCATFSRSLPHEFADIYPVEVFCWIPLASYLANL